MKERPILFSGPMVRAILEGRKSQTRRVVRLPEVVCSESGDHDLTTIKWSKAGGDYAKAGWRAWMSEYPEEGSIELTCPYGAPGDRLWVRESAYIAPPLFGPAIHDNATDSEGRSRLVGYRASMNADEERSARDYGLKPSPSIHMPRWASRLTLEVTGVRVERLNSISEEDARAESCRALDGVRIQVGNPQEKYVSADAHWHFNQLWDSINGKKPGHSWADNPWVWVIEFTRAPKGEPKP